MSQPQRGQGTGDRGQGTGRQGGQKSTKVHEWGVQWQWQWQRQWQWQQCSPVAVQFVVKAGSPRAS